MWAALLRGRPPPSPLRQHPALKRGEHGAGGRALPSPTSSRLCRLSVDKFLGVPSPDFPIPQMRTEVPTSLGRHEGHTQGARPGSSRKPS